MPPSTTTEKRLTNELQACREEYQDLSIDTVGSVQTANTVVGSLTNINQRKLIQEVTKANNLSTVAEQWVIRSQDFE